MLIAVFAATLAAVAHAVTVEGLPEPAEPRPPKFPPIQEKTFGNGLRVIVVERPGLPLVSAEVLLASGSEADPPAASGLATFTADLLTQGTGTRTATQIAREVEALGATIKARAEWDGTSVVLSALSAQIEPAFALLADVTRHPKFAPDEVERLRKQKLDDLRVALEEPMTVARLAVRRVVLGSDPYAHSADGTPASLKRLRRDEVAEFHRTRYTAKQAQILIVGNIRAGAAFVLAEKNFGDWEGAGEAPGAAGRDDAPAKARAVVIDMPNAGQAAVLIGAPGIARGTDDYFRGIVMNSALGGGYTSRLNQEIRVKRGLTYGASSALAAMRTTGLSTAGCQTKNPSVPEVVKLIRDEVKRMSGEPVTPEFLATRQALLEGGLARDLETNGDYLKRLTHYAMYGLPLSSLAEFDTNVRAVKPADISKFAARHLKPEATSVVVVGHAREFVKPLRALFPALEVIPQADLDLDSPALRRTGAR